MGKYICRHCKEEKDESNDMLHNLMKEQKNGWIVLFTPLCPKCFQELLSKPIEELFPLKDFMKKV